MKSTDLLRKIVQATSQTTGRDHFVALARGLADALGVRYCFVTECLDSPTTRVGTLAFWAGQDLGSNFEYDVLATPCERVLLEGHSCVFGEDVQALFPDDRDLVELGAESYAAAPLISSAGDVLGHLVILDDRPLTDGRRPDMSLLEIFAARAAAELERWQATAELAQSEARLRSVVEGTAAALGEAFFRSLVRHLAKALGTHYAVVAELDGDLVRTRALWGGDGFLKTVEYPLAGSPCLEVVRSGVTAFHPRDLGRIFPDHCVPADLGAESYLGTPLFDVDRQPIGLLAVLDQKPMTKNARDATLLSVFAARAAAEIQRERLETHRQMLQSQVLHVQKLESLGVLAGGIAHDFNNLLCGILGHVELALLRSGDDSPIHSHLRAIQTAAKRSAELAEQMLAYSGKGRFVVTRLDLNQLIEEMLELLSTSISKKVRLGLDLDRQLPAIKGDATQMRQVMMNLMMNASDAIGEASGRITVRTGVCEADRAYLRGAYLAEHLPEGRYLFIEVEDDGCGMDDETRDRLFDPFFTTKRDGRGLGLAALLGIVRGHQGAVRVASRLGEGATFRILLPGQSEPSEAPAPVPVDVPAWDGGGKILLVDDEAIVLETTRKLLESLGFEVLTAENGRRGIEVFSRHAAEIQVVVLDMMMPELDGLETFRELKRLDPEVKAFIASGYSRQSIASLLEDEGLVGFVQKPFRRDQLGAKLREILD